LLQHLALLFQSSGITRLLKIDLNALFSDSFAEQWFPIFRRPDLNGKLGYVMLAAPDIDLNVPVPPRETDGGG
jgi:esterase/lipase superfamily enzyme